jgi:hypothetical protein
LSPDEAWGTRAATIMVAVMGAMSPSDVAASPAELALSAVRDNTLFESETGDLSSGMGPAVFAGDNATLNTRRALLYFDVVGQVPPGSTVLHAEIRLHVSSVPNVESRPLNVHRMLAGWGEGTSNASGGGGAPAAPGDATWLHRFFPNSLWSSPGGDFATGASAATAVPDTGTYVWSGPDLVADIQSWIDGSATEFGWMVRGEEGVSQSVRRIDSREVAEPVFRPLLWLEFLPAATETLSWGLLKYRYRR